MQAKLEQLMVVIVMLAIVLAPRAVNADLVAHWGLDGNANDSISGNRGVLIGNPSWETGCAGGALSFDGDDYVMVPNESDFDITNQITVAAWIKVNAFDKQWQAIVTKGDNSWRLSRNGQTNSVKFNCDGLQGQELGPRPGVAGSIEVNDGRWHHVAGVYDGSKICLYMDGALHASAKASGSINTNNFDVYIGENAQRGERQWNGLIDDLVIFNEALSEAGIKQLYKQGGKSFIPKLLQELNGSVRQAEIILKQQGAQKAVTFIEKRLAQYQRSKEKNQIYLDARRRLVSSLYFLLAKAKETAGAPSRDIAAAFQESVSLSLRTPTYVPALLWLFRNTPIDDYVAVVKKSMQNNESALHHIHRVAKDFESRDDWAAFGFFLDGVFAEVDNTSSFAEAVAGALKEDGAWADRFSKYARTKPELARYVIGMLQERAQGQIERSEFLKAAETYHTIVKLCRTDQDKIIYEFKVCECIFSSGQHAKAISELDDFIRGNKATNRLLVKQAILVKGRAYLQLSEIDRAQDTFLQLMIDYPETKQAPEAGFFIGYCDMLEGRFEKAKEALTFVVEDYPESPYARKARLCLRRIERMTE